MRGVLWPTVLLLACACAGEHRDQRPETDAGPSHCASPPELDPSLEAADDTCVERTVSGCETYVSLFTRRTWDAEARVLTEEHATDESFNDLTQSNRSLFTLDGRIVAAIEGDTYQYDYRYDEHDNLTEFRLSTPEVPDLKTPSTASAQGSQSYLHEYDDEGRLLSSKGTLRVSFDREVRERDLHFTEDTDGRCARIDSTEGGATLVETRVYAEGRLAHLDIEDERRTRLTTEDRTYDAGGRLLTRHRETTQTGVSDPSATETHTYLEDGTEEIALDRPDRFVSYVTRSRGCPRLDALTEERHDLHCRVRSDGY